MGLGLVSEDLLLVYWLLLFLVFLGLLCLHRLHLAVLVFLCLLSLFIFLHTLPGLSSLPNLLLLTCVHGFTVFGVTVCVCRSLFLGLSFLFLIFFFSLVSMASPFLESPFVSAGAFFSDFLSSLFASHSSSSFGLLKGFPSKHLLRISLKESSISLRT